MRLSKELVTDDRFVDNVPVIEWKRDVKGSTIDMSREMRLKHVEQAYDVLLSLNLSRLYVREAKK